MVKIKQIPEDFVVEEVPEEFYFGEGNYSIYEMHKRNLTTHDAAFKIAEKLGVSLKDIGYAGSKDKHAVTSQLISIKKKISQNFDFGDNLRLEFRRFLKNPISLGDLKGNKFKIVLRDLEKFDVDRINTNAELLRFLDWMLPNYFDEQRFSSANIEIGITLLKKNYVEAVRLIDEHGNLAEVRNFLGNQPHDYVGALRNVPRRLLMIYVHSVQSHLFNELVNSYLDNVESATVPYSRGEFFFPKQQAEQREILIPGFSMEFLPEEESLTKELLQRHGLSEPDFLNRSLPELNAESIRRKLLMKVENFNISASEADELNEGKQKLSVSFFLGKGSYATIVCKFLTAVYD
ncbi:MAG: tRNA pseudouridine(13) synthase TruD [Nanoarchaeota archaeon]|nr:MAG: tRNA pseudouridine(13) synthase TruD [Nanoarchaeota archaeon]